MIGLNSIAAYCIAHLFEPFLLSTFATHVGADKFDGLGPAYATLLSGTYLLLLLVDAVLDVSSEVVRAHLICCSSAVT